MRTVPRLHFRFDESVGHGRDMEALIRDATEADSVRHADSADTSED